MADVKISALPAAGTLSGTEPLPIVQGGVTKQTTPQDIADLYTLPFTAETIDAIQGANNPDSTNVFLTKLDVPAFSILSTAPVGNQDIDHGYEVGFIIKNTTTGLVYICTDSTAGAAVWELDQSHVYSFRKTLNQANIYAAGYFDITECPAVAGYAWVCQNAQAQLSGSTTPYDGGSKVAIITDTAGTPQFSDVDASLLAGSDSIGGLVSAITLNQIYTSDIYIPNKKLQVNLNQTSAAGDGNLTVFGTAVLIKTT